MNKEELLLKLETLLGEPNTRAQFDTLSNLGDFILENFVEKPEPTAKDRLATEIFEGAAIGLGMTINQAHQIANHLLSNRFGEVQDIICHRRNEVCR